MRIKDFAIDTESYERIKADAERNSNKNPGCALVHYWDGRINLSIEEKALADCKLGYGFVGGGWPKVKDQTWAMGRDLLELRFAFDQLDWDCRDVGDAIYQGNTLIPYLPSDRFLSIVEFGSGYGRLAVPFVHHLAREAVFIGIDSVPVSLLIAPQFVKAMTGAKVANCHDKFEAVEECDFISLPAWRIDELRKDKFDLFITIHSFQEMTREAIDFYVDFASNTADDGALFYSINLWPEDQYVPSNWNLIFDRAFPINRDGNFNEKLWRIC